MANETDNSSVVLVCSVLNTVIDHVMVPATELYEGDEIRRCCRSQDKNGTSDNVPQQKASVLLVPVLRIFGPILRRDSGRVIAEPLQSACLYVHNAYPYLLARPVVAGPDASLRHNDLSSNIDWDDPVAVRRVVPFFLDLLEDTLQTSFLDSTLLFPRQTDNSATINRVTNPCEDPPLSGLSKSLPPAGPRIIRQITVVIGRGFYTYCPGPPAPFLRIEYYDPSNRWRVKRTLENGLDVPSSWHPPPPSVSTSQFNDDGDHDEHHEVDHDTGQAFVSEGDQTRSRSIITRRSNPEGSGAFIPLQFHCYEAHIPYSMQVFKDYNLSGLSYIHLRRYMKGAIHRDSSTGSFPVGSNENVIQSLRFRHPLPSVAAVQARVQKAQRHSVDDFNAAIEHELLFLDSNTSAGLKWPLERLPDPNEHQHAPPLNHNLVVLKKETSCDLELDATVESIANIEDVITSPPDCSENDGVIHWRAVPSLQELWSQERRRMHKLLPPEVFSQQPTNLTLTVPQGQSGGQVAARGMRRLVACTSGLEENFRRVLNDIVNRHLSSIENVDHSILLRKQVVIQREIDSPSLRSNNLFGRNCQQASRSIVADGLTPSQDQVIDALEQLGDFDPVTSEEQNATCTPLELEDGLVALGSDAASKEQTIDGKGDRLVALRSDAASKEQTIDGKEDSYGCNKDDLNSCKAVEPSLSHLPSHEYQRTPIQCIPTDARAYFEMTQRIERGEGILDHDEFEHIDDLINPLTLAPYTDANDEASVEEDENQLQTALSTLATQSQQHVTDHVETTPANESEVGNEESSSIDSLDLLASCGELCVLKSIERDEHERTDESLQTKEYLDQDARIPSPVEHVNAWEHPPGVCIHRKGVPPSRAEIVVSNGLTGLYPMTSTGETPSWASHLLQYEKSCASLPARGVWFPESGRVMISRTRPAPTNGTMTSWRKRRMKRSLLQTTNFDPKRLKLSHDTRSCYRGYAEGNNASSYMISESRPTVQVEEVLWHLSQRQSLSGTQQSQIEVRTTQIETDEAQVALSSRESQDLSRGATVSSSQSSRQSKEHDVENSGIQNIGNQGGRILVHGAGELKSKTTLTHGNSSSPNDVKLNADLRVSLPTPVSVMSIEAHVQCRTGRAGVNDSKTIAMTPDSDRDRLFAIVFAYGRDPGGGEPVRILEYGYLFIPVDNECNVNVGKGDNPVFEKLSREIRRNTPRQVMGISAPLLIECVRDERHLLLRFSSLVRWKDPDMLISWDPQGLGLGYIIERGLASQGTDLDAKEIDMVRLLSRTPKLSQKQEWQFPSTAPRSTEVDGSNVLDPSGKEKAKQDRWKGSGLGTDWDERVGAGAAAASINGRLVFAAWKLVAEEVKHPNVSYLPAVVWSLLNKRIPHHDNIVLTQWYGCNQGRERWRVLYHKLVQTTACLLLFDALDVVGRSGEAARLSGVEFSQSFPGIRGSQYKVEGVLLRALKSLNSDERGYKKGSKVILTGITGSSSLSEESKSQTQSPWKTRRHRQLDYDQAEEEEKQFVHDLSTRSYFFFSPSLADANKQEALEVQALTLEPQSSHVSDPVVVCDFTALYPSLIIAYNLCYSTCAGKLEYHSTRREMRQEGKTTGRVGPYLYSENRSATVVKHHIKSLTPGFESKDRAYVVPTGSIFVAESVVKGVLPQVLEEILSTRAMLKKAAKLYQKYVPNLSPSILRQLEARQLALKYIANVTYGYTSATFSGRCAMPLLADAIVECGRRTLTNAINLANEWGMKGKWQRCEVLYGDTDSVFVRLPGRSVKEAFQFGEEFCRAVTATNPPPVQLKLEKVYLGSILQTKKKYCGMKFESRDQTQPTFEAKGLETIRRDQCTLTQKVLRNALITLFQSGPDGVKRYLFRQWALIHSGELPVSDFVLTGRVRSRYRGGGVGPVQAVLARRLAEADPGRVVRHKERLAYVIVATPGVTFRLRDCVLTPQELLEQWDAYSIHSEYYITRHVNAALQRCLGLAPHKIDVNSWYESCPKPRRRIHFWPITRSGNSLMISTYFGSDICALCGKKCMANGRSRAAVCSLCRNDSIKSLQVAMSQLNTTQRDALAIANECGSCNLCFEDATTFARVTPSQKWQQGGIVVPLANCTCIECPNTFERHRLKEAELKSLEICNALDSF